jgi:hypothetical protein
MIYASVGFGGRGMKATIVRVCLMVLCCALGACQNMVKVADNTSFQWTSPSKKILLVQPDVQLGELSAGGTFEPRADWTGTAQGYIAEDTANILKAKSIDLVRDMQAPSPRDFQIEKLHGVVGRAILTHLYIDTMKLPAKGNALDWTLGPGANGLRDRYGADYALFVYVRDSYTTAGRALVMLGAAMFGVGIQGGTQVGFASLVDLRTGNIVWFNQIANATGDLRTPKPAQDTVTDLLKGFPL